jgi:hypothetical protein
LAAVLAKRVHFLDHILPVLRLPVGGLEFAAKFLKNFGELSQKALGVDRMQGGIEKWCFRFPSYLPAARCFGLVQDSAPDVFTKLLTVPPQLLEPIIGIEELAKCGFALVVGVDPAAAK